MRITGRFVCEESRGRVVYRVRTLDYEPWAYALALFGFALAASRLIPGGVVVTLALQLAALLFLLERGASFSRWRGIARSTYPRLRRSLDIHRVEAPAGPTPFRVSHDDLSVVVDGHAFSRADGPRMLVAVSDESVLVGKYERRHFRRFRPTLITPHALYELDVYEENDEADAKVLADDVARALDPKAVPASPNVPWSPPSRPMLRRTWSAAFLALPAMFLAIGSMLLGPLAEKSRAVLHISWLVFGATAALLYWDIERSAREFGKRRDQDAKALRGACAKPHR